MLWEWYKPYSFSNFEIYNKLLLTVITKTILQSTETLYPLISIFPFLSLLLQAVEF